MSRLKITAGSQAPEIVRRAEVEAPQTQWWKLPKGQRAGAIKHTVDMIEREQSGRRALDILHMSMYGAGNIAGEGLRASVRWNNSQPLRLRMNIVSSICNSLKAKIAKLRPRPKFITEDGSWHLKKKAEAAEQAIDGEFYRNRIDQLSPMVALDAFVLGTGFWKVSRQGKGYPVIERVHPCEVNVDYYDGLHGDPQCIYHSTIRSRDSVLDQYGGSPQSNKYKAIQAAQSVPSTHYPWLIHRPNHSDVVHVIEAWHRGCDGNQAHVICVGDVELFSNTLWDGREFPIVPYRWEPRQYGYFGRGAAEEITPQQIEINYTLEKIQYILHNVSTVRHWMQAGGKIELNAVRMTNTPGEILKYYGPNPPTTEVVNAVPTQLLEHPYNLKRDAFEAIGLSQAFATASKPAGLNSGEAQRVYEDVGTERLIVNGRMYEQAHMELVKRVIDVKREIANDPTEKESPVVVTRKRARGVTAKSLSFKDFDLEKDIYQMQILEQSALPGTPSGKTATVNEWLQMGLITPDEGKELLNMPDIQSELNLSLATKDSVLSAVECIVDDGEWYAPHPFLDLALAARLAVASWTRAEREGVPEDRLELLARYIDELEQLTALAQGPAPAAPPAGPPMGGPALPDVAGQMGGVPALPPAGY